VLRFPMKRCSAGSELGMHRATLATHLGPRPASGVRFPPRPPSARPVATLLVLCAPRAQCCSPVLSVSMDTLCLETQTPGEGRPTCECAARPGARAVGRPCSVPAWSGRRVSVPPRPRRNRTGPPTLIVSWRARSSVIYGIFRRHVDVTSGLDRERLTALLGPASRPRCTCGVRPAVALPCTLALSARALKPLEW
jgi:hypothetical protein